MGALLSYDWSRSRTEVNIQEGNISAKASLIAIDRMWFAGGRLGFLVTDKTLVYGLLGYSWISVEDLRFSASDGSSTIAFGLPLPSSQGITFGGGIEHKLANNVALRAEYRLTDYGREIIFQDPSSSVVMTGQAQSHVARIGAFYRFGGGADTEQESEAWTATGNWTGLHVGAGLGLTSYLRDLIIAGSSAGHVGDKAEISGLGGGNMIASISAGYDFQIMPRVIAGVIATFDVGTQNHDLTFSILGAKSTIDLLNQKYGWSIGGRVGYLLSPSLLGYVTGGFAQVQFADAALTVENTDIYRFPFDLLNGVFAGVGFEKQFDGRWSVRTEYQYAAFETYRVANFAAGGDRANVSFDPSSHAVKLSIGYRFGP